MNSKKVNLGLGKLEQCADICRKIYIARNITLSEKDLLDALKEIDILLREKSEN